MSEIGIKTKIAQYSEPCRSRAQDSVTTVTHHSILQPEATDIVKQPTAGDSVNMLAQVATLADTGIATGEVLGAVHLSRSLLVVIASLRESESSRFFLLCEVSATLES